MGWLATAGLALALVAADGGEGPERPGPPKSGDGPVDVEIGFYALDFARITAREESFDVTGYLELRWRDPRLAAPKDEPASSGTARRVDPAKTWVPQVFFENALEPPRYHHDPVVEVDGRGVVSRWVILSGKFSSEMDVSRFPFDRQSLAVKVVAFEDQSIVKFSVARDLVRVGDEAFVTDWTVGAPSAQVGSRAYVTGEEPYGRFVYQVGVARRSTFYVWRVMLPLTLLVVVSWAAFWFEPVGLQPQISTCMASLIALVAFNFAIDFSLPKVGYLTLIDRHALIGFGFVSAAVVEVALVHRAVTRDRLGLALSVQRVSRWAFPLGYALAVASNLVILI